MGSRISRDPLWDPSSALIAGAAAAVRIPRGGAQEFLRGPPGNGDTAPDPCGIPRSTAGSARRQQIPNPSLIPPQTAPIHPHLPPKIPFSPGIHLGGAGEAKPRGASAFSPADPGAVPGFIPGSRLEFLLFPAGIPAFPSWNSCLSRRWEQRGCPWAQRIPLLLHPSLGLLRGWNSAPGILLLPLSWNSALSRLLPPPLAFSRLLNLIFQKDQPRESTPGCGTGSAPGRAVPPRAPSVLPAGFSWRCRSQTAPCRGRFGSGGCQRPENRGEKSGYCQWMLLEVEVASCPDRTRLGFVPSRWNLQGSGGMEDEFPLLPAGSGGSLRAPSPSALFRRGGNNF